MLAEAQTLKKIIILVKQLSSEYRLRLVQQVIQTLIQPSRPQQQPQLLRFGEFKGNEGAMSTLEDFTIAEWRPTDEELDGP